MTQRIHDYLERTAHEAPCLVMDLERVRDNYQAFAHAMPDTRVFYAIKANPAPAILELLAGLGSCFDAASVAEIRMALAAGATPDRVSYSNTIKRERDIATAFDLGVRQFAFDCDAELEKIARVAPGSRVVCRLLCDGEGADWPLSKKFGCAPAMAGRLMRRAHELGLEAHGLAFHVGSQQPNPGMWDGALATCADLFRQLGEQGIEMKMVNLGGGFPARYLRDVPQVEMYGQAITGSLKRHFGNRIPQTIIEPGRGLVGDAGIIRSEIVLISKKDDDDPVRWVYLDIGKFGGLAETIDEAIRYPIRTDHDGEELAPVVLAGPTCDSVDVMYEKEPYLLPVSIEIGETVMIESTGAYTATYASNGFNGFDPLRCVCI
ncbi:MAG: ornithine decarboxylase [Rhizobiales bacterium NRL2]|jgi:ornithine decarboxylase|nr:MAG: ornithine decarboxylase [Rhizobiales bacterium NRL2]